MTESLVTNTRKICSVDDCENGTNSLGLCNKHYLKFRKYGDPVPVINKHVFPTVCAVDGCKKAYSSKGYCRSHYRRWKEYGDPLHQKVSRAQRGCEYEGCTKPHNAKGYCYTHYNRIRRWGDPSVLKEKGWHLNNGYIYVTDPNNKGKAIAQHRLVMQEHLGRLLTKEENVHHKNGDRYDNRIENLEIWNKSQPSGQRLDDKIEHAVQILKQYAPHLLKE